MPEGVHRLVASASGAPGGGIETVTGVPVRCMNRIERLVGLLAARRPEPAMTVARSVSDVLDDHVVFEVESIDRMYLNVWQPRLAYGGGVQGFFVGHRGYHYASAALMDPMTKTFVADIHGFVAARGLQLVGFAKGQRKDDLTQQFLGKFTQDEGVLFVGRAQEKAGVWHTQRRYNPATGGSYAWLVRLHGVHQLLLLLLRGRRLRPVLPQVRHLLPLHSQAVHQRQRVGRATRGRTG